MPLTTLDPKTALISIDLQKGIVGMPVSPPASSVVRRAAELADAFRKRKLLVVLVHVEGGAPGRTEQPKPAGRAADWAELVPELNRQPTDHVVSKRQWGAFTGTGLDEHLKKLGVTQVVVMGIATSIGVESTARHAFELGYNVTLAIDAMADMNAEAHANSIIRIFPRLGETGTVADIIAWLGNHRA